MQKSKTQKSYYTRTFWDSSQITLKKPYLVVCVYSFLHSQSMYRHELMTILAGSFQIPKSLLGDNSEYILFKQFTYHEHNKSHSSCNTFVSCGLWKTGFPDSCDGIFLQIRSLCCKGRPWSFFFFLKAHTIPMMRQAGTFSFPIFQKCHSWKLIKN